MSGPSTLAALMEGLGLNDDMSDTNQTNAGRCHLLTFEYPAVDLLPPGETVFLEPPVGMAARCQPNSDSLEPDLSTAFFIQLRAPHYTSMAREYKNVRIESLRELGQNLADYEGRSRFRAVSYIPDNDLLPVHRLQVLTQLITDEKEWRLCEAQLDDSEWCLLLELSTSTPWIDLLRDLVTRASERAYFDVRWRMIAAGREREVLQEDASLADSWNSQPVRSAKEILCSRLRLYPGADNQTLQLDDISDPNAADEVRNLRLPCGHILAVEKRVLINLHVETCDSTACPVCSAKVLTPQDGLEIQESSERVRLCQYRNSHGKWVRLSQQANAIPVERVLGPYTLIQSMQLTRISFEAPQLICPALLSPHHLYHEGALAVERKIWLDYCQSREPVRITLTELSNILYDVAARQSEKMPPGWMEFATSWARRTVAFIMRRPCESMELSHGSLHQHYSPPEEAGWYYNAAAEPGWDELAWQIQDWREELEYLRQRGMND